ncbi:MAG: hypothetical protein HY562_12630 [Ignavibacteriales bacterium]|nr:hypothetical protein [Ignavibacteriales bacterium]
MAVLLDFAAGWCEDLWKIPSTPDVLSAIQFFSGFREEGRARLRGCVQYALVHRMRERVRSARLAMTTTKEFIPEESGKEVIILATKTLNQFQRAVRNLDDNAARREKRQRESSGKRYTTEELQEFVQLL